MYCHWDIFYRNVLQRYLKGSLRDKQTFFLGVENGVVELGTFSRAVPDDVKTKLKVIEEDVKHNQLIFSGKLYDTKGNLRCGEKEALSEEALFKEMNWIVSGVEVLPRSLPQPSIEATSKGQTK